MKNRLHFSKTMYAVCMALVGLVLTNRVSAQTPYRPFTDGCQWSVSDEKYMTAGDTVIDGVTYLKLYMQISNQPFEFNLSDAHYFTAIRNDTVEKKVYCNLPGGTRVYRDNQLVRQTETSQEYLLYDFSVALGDTVTYYTVFRDYNTGEVGGVVECQSVISDHAYITSSSTGGNNHDDVCFCYDTVAVLSNGDSCRRILLEGLSPLMADDIWMEGIGSIMGFNNEFYNWMEAPSKRLLCFTDAEGVFLHTGFDLDATPDNCYNRSYTSDISERNTESFTLYPNPANNTFTIDFTETQENLKQVRVMDVLGKEVMSVENLSSNTVNIANLPAGLYNVRVLSQSGKVYSSKLVKE